MWRCLYLQRPCPLPGFSYFAAFGTFLGIKLWAVVCSPQPITAHSIKTRRGQLWMLCLQLLTFIPLTLNWNHDLSLPKCFRLTTSPATTCIRYKSVELPSLNKTLPLGMLRAAIHNFLLSFILWLAYYIRDCMTNFFGGTRDFFSALYSAMCQIFWKSNVTLHQEEDIIIT